MKKLVSVSFISVSIFMGIAFFSCNAQIPKAELKTDIDSISYAQGVLYSSQVDQIFAQLELDSTCKVDFARGFKEGFNIDSKDKKATAYTIGKTIGLQLGLQFIPYFNNQLFEGDSTQTISRENFMSGYLSNIMQPEKALIHGEEARIYSTNATEKIRNASLEKKYADVKKENENFLEKNKSQAGVIVLPSGLQYKVIKEGKGPKPSETDVVKVHYHGTDIHGTVFDSSVERGTPSEFSLNHVIKGWTEGIQLMPVGSKYTFYVPYYLAYGEQGRGGNIGPFSTLIFDVELLDIVKK
ncbi:MAG: FKBP-type peptidyl-prolyl cis-trans isomerase [Candidatus Azobacteroides sp.]|nr:FKBP-type peptidyl-prolyl cis-trans isomerase [Candidatus Azobacteroides sp.]